MSSYSADIPRLRWRLAHAVLTLTLAAGSLSAASDGRPTWPCEEPVCRPAPTDGLIAVAFAPDVLADYLLDVPTESRVEYFPYGTRHAYRDSEGTERLTILFRLYPTIAGAQRDMGPGPAVSDGRPQILEATESGRRSYVGLFGERQANYRSRNLFVSLGFAETQLPADLLWLQQTLPPAVDAATTLSEEVPASQIDVLGIVPEHNRSGAQSAPRMGRSLLLRAPAGEPVFAISPRGWSSKWVDAIDSTGTYEISLPIRSSATLNILDGTGRVRTVVVDESALIPILPARLSRTWKDLTDAEKSRLRQAYWESPTWERHHILKRLLVGFSDAVAFLRTVAVRDGEIEMRRLALWHLRHDPRELWPIAEGSDSPLLRLEALVYLGYGHHLRTEEQRTAARTLAMSIAIGDSVVLERRREAALALCCDDSIERGELESSVQRLLPLYRPLWAGEHSARP